MKEKISIEKPLIVAFAIVGIILLIAFRKQYLEFIAGVGYVLATVGFSSLVVAVPVTIAVVGVYMLLKRQRSAKQK